MCHSVPLSWVTDGNLVTIAGVVTAGCCGERAKTVILVCVQWISDRKSLFVRRLQNHPFSNGELPTDIHWICTKMTAAFALSPRHLSRNNRRLDCNQISSIHTRQQRRRVTASLQLDAVSPKDFLRQGDRYNCDYSIVRLSDSVTYFDCFANLISITNGILYLETYRFVTLVPLFCPDPVVLSHHPIITKVKKYLTWQVRFYLTTDLTNWRNRLFLHFQADVVRTEPLSLRTDRSETNA